MNTFAAQISYLLTYKYIQTKNDPQQTSEVYQRVNFCLALAILKAPVSCVSIPFEKCFHALSIWMNMCFQYFFTYLV